MGELQEKGALWFNLYREWMQSEHGDDEALMTSLRYLADSGSQATGAAQRLSTAYDEFYGTAGRLKDLARKDAAGAQRRYPWAPPNIASLLGTARPKTFDELVEHGAGGPWTPVFRAWLAAQRPFAEAAGWFDWMLQNNTRADEWRRHLDPTVKEFADEIGLLKSALRDIHGNKLERSARQAGDLLTEAAQTAAELAQGAALAGGQPNAPVGARQPVQPAQRAPSGGAAQQTPGAPAPATAQPTPRAAAPARSQVPAGVRRQLVAAMPLLTAAPNLTGWAEWLAGRFSSFGGTLAEEAAGLNGYKQLVEGDATDVAEQLTAASEQLTRATDDELFATLAAVRAAVFRLAWDVDLGYPSNYGGWPHQRVAVVVQALMEAQSACLRYAGGLALYRLATDIDRVYDSAAALLDTALQVIAAQVPGYEVDDGAEAWSTHEVVGAKAQLGELTQLVAQWAGEQPAAEEDQATLDEAAYASFGIPYEHLQQLAR